MRPIIFLFSTVLAIAVANHPPMPRRGLLHTWPKSPPTRLQQAASSRNINVLDYGADPTGKNDSWSAIQKAVDAAKAMYIDATLGSSLAIDLQGGAYRIDTTIDLGNLRGVVIGGGSLIAGPGFDNGSALLFCWYCQQLMIRDITIDNQHRGGGLLMVAPLQCQIDNAFFSHFATYGVFANDSNGHELLITNSFFEEYHWGEPGYNSSSTKSGTAIKMWQPDSHIINVVARCSRGGIESYSDSNVIDSAHIYSSCSHLDQGNDVTTCFLLGGARVINSYVDDCHMNLTSLNDIVVIMNNRFYGVSTLSLSPKVANAKVNGVRVVNNAFVHSEVAIGQPRLLIDDSAGSIDLHNIYNTTIENDGAVGTRARGRAAFVGLPARVDIDLSSQLIFVASDAVYAAAIMLDAATCQYGRNGVITATHSIVAQTASRFSVFVNSFEAAAANCKGVVTLSIG